MAYTAPTIKDRVATGDNQFIREDMGGNKVRLTPAPDEVLESGTDINKALLQPLCDAVEAIDAQTVPAVEKLLPYNQYYWLSRGISGYYSENQQLAYAHSGSYTYKSGTSGVFERIENYMIWLFHFDDSSEQSSCSVQYSSSISISQSDGTITLNNPKTRVFTEDESNTTIQNVLDGKYVKGLKPATNQIFYIPVGSEISSAAWAGDSGGNWRGYIWIVYNDADVTEGTGPEVMYVSSKYNSTNSDWEIINSTEPNTYPENGVVNGTEYIKLGRIDNYVLNSALNIPTVINITYANFSSGKCDINITAPRFAFIAALSQGNPWYRGDYMFGIGNRMTSTGMGIIWNNDGENAKYNWFSLANGFAGSKSDFPINGDTPSFSSNGVQITSKGIRLLGSTTGKVIYMPI